MDINDEDEHNGPALLDFRAFKEGKTGTGNRARPVDIFIRSEGYQDEGRERGDGTSYIRVNGHDHSPHGRGHNVVVVDARTGAVLDARNFDTHGDLSAAVRFRKYLDSIRGCKIVLVAIQDEGFQYGLVAFDALTRLGPKTDSIWHGFRGSYALVGYSGAYRPSWITQKQAEKGKGPSEISLQVPLIADGNEYILEEQRVVRSRQDKEKALNELIRSDQPYSVHDIKRIVTAEHLCCCEDPITMAFRVNNKLKTLADTYTENSGFLNKLADQTKDFAVQLIDQVTDKEDLTMNDLPEQVDHHVSMLGDMIDAAIEYSQKQFVTHPILYKRVKMRWNLGLPDALKKFRSLLYLLILIDTVLTPFLLPVIGYAFHRDQKKKRKLDNSVESSEGSRLNGKRSDQDKLDKYLGFITSPLVIFVKDKLSQVVFIAFHVRVCILASTIYPRFEEYLIFVFFAGLVLSELQQYRRSNYFTDVWNYFDVITLLLYVPILILRIVTIVRGGDPYQNRVLEIVNYLYGVNTMLLVLRFSSILTLHPVIGPLQLALFRMLRDLLIILVQIFVVVIAFSLAITKSYVAEMSYLTSTNNQTGDLTKYYVYCEQGTIKCLVKTSGKLIWSVLGLTELQDLESHTSFTTNFVAVLYLMFLVLSVTLFVNLLVAVLDNTYDNFTSNKQIRWKFSRARKQNIYFSSHCIVVPFNLLSVPLRMMYVNAYGNSRKEEARQRREDYKEFYRARLFPTITRRYKEKHGSSFPLTADEKIDLMMADLRKLRSDYENQLGVPRSITDGSSGDADLPGNENISNGAEANAALVQMSSSV